MPRHCREYLRQNSALCVASRLLLMTVACLSFSGSAWSSTVAHSRCRVEPTTFEGWHAEQLSNDWVRLTIVPQLGGRLMQVEFGGHAYLFVNSRYKGKYIPPSEATKIGRWINYGGDKIWPLPEGRGDDQHWPGPVSDVLDDGEYSLTVRSQGSRCAVRLEGPADPTTGLEYSRDIAIGSDSPEISFHAVMKNSSQHSIRWSMQSVTQYDTADPKMPSDYNHDFWAFAPLNAQGAYPDGYRVRSGLADDPSFSTEHGLFILHWLYLENEVWLDSQAGWLAVIDNSTDYGMVERFQYVSGGDYPGKASLIFYKNGAALELDEHGRPSLRSTKPEQAPYYMEAEINSPMVGLDPGGSYALDTTWYPVRAGKDFREITAAGILTRPLTASLTSEGIQLSGSFAVFFPGKLTAHLLDERGVESSVVPLESVDPLKALELHRTLNPVPGAARISIRLDDDQGRNQGSLGEAPIVKPQQES